MRHFCVPSNWIQPAKESRYVICRMLFSSSLTSRDIAHFHVLMEVSFTNDQHFPLLSNSPTSFWPVIISLPAVHSCWVLGKLICCLEKWLSNSENLYISLCALKSWVLSVVSVWELQWKSGEKGQINPYNGFHCRLSCKPLATVTKQHLNPASGRWR